MSDTQGFGRLSFPLAGCAGGINLPENTAHTKEQS